jgi:Cupredoxin-like domain
VRLLPPAAIASLLLAGCSATPAVRAGHELDLTLTEYRISPRAISVPAGRLRIVAHNRGILTHNVELERGTLDSGERAVLAIVHTLLPGSSGTVVTGPLPPGRYLLVSAVGNQTTLGMVATLTVR